MINQSDLSKTSLKMAAMILFWFGVIAEFFIMSGFFTHYYHHGTFDFSPFGLYLAQGFQYFLYFLYLQFGHTVHIVSGYWLAKGRKKGAILGFSLCLYEIISFLVPNVSPDLLTPVGIGFRILFAFVIFLLISGRKGLVQLRSENWRPWKNPIR